MNIRHIGVIGAGISGLVTAKTLIEAGYEVTVFEKQKGLGGVWEKSRSYVGQGTQNTKDTYHFTDYPIPISYPEWPTAKQMESYLMNPLSVSDYGVFCINPRKGGLRVLCLRGGKFRQVTVNTSL